MCSPSRLRAAQCRAGSHSAQSQRRDQRSLYCFLARRERGCCRRRGIGYDQCRTIHSGRDKMPVAKIRGVDIAYEILGDRGPFVALQPGGRRAGVSLKPLAAKIAEAGYRVIIYDRRNCGASSVAIEGASENEEWVEDLHELLAHLDASPAFVGGSSSGCRLALLLALRRPRDVRGLLLWRVTGGAHAAVHLANQYYTSHMEAAQHGGMAAVCAMEHWTEVINANPGSRNTLMAMQPADFVSRMTRWRQSFQAGAEHA